MTQEINLLGYTESLLYLKSLFIPNQLQQNNFGMFSNRRKTLTSGHFGKDYSGLGNKQLKDSCWWHP